MYKLHDERQLLLTYYRNNELAKYFRKRKYRYKFEELVLK